MTDWAMPGTASCFTRIWGNAKLWTMSLLERCTMTGLFTGVETKYLRNNRIGALSAPKE